MSFFTSLKVNGAGLAVERLRVDLASANLANANATRSPEGGPYRRRDAVLRSIPLDAFGSALDRAVLRPGVTGVRVDPRPPREIFAPEHPDADENGILRLPNVKLVEEMTNLMQARRAYEANLAALSASREMAQRALRIGR